MSYEYQDDTIGIIYRNSSESSKLRQSNKNINNNRNHMTIHTPSNCESNVLNTSGYESDIHPKRGDEGSPRNFNYIKESLNSDSYCDNNDNSILNNLKESIRSNFKSIKKEKEKIISNNYYKYQTNTNFSHDSQSSSKKYTIDSKGKTEKEKLLEYYKSI
jgi:hypothetical protein